MASCQDLHTFGSERYATSAPTVNFRLVEASDPKAIVAFVSKYTFWNDANVVPVVDIAEVSANQCGFPRLGAECVEKLSEWPSGRLIGSNLERPPRGGFFFWSAR